MCYGSYLRQLDRNTLETINFNGMMSITLKIIVANYSIQFVDQAQVQFR
jgi:hypothetical protein